MSPSTTNIATRARSPCCKPMPARSIELRSLKPRTEVRGIRQYKEKLAFIASIPHARAAPALVGQAIITFAGKDVGATINGVIPDLMRNVSTIDEHFVEGSLETLATNPDGIVLGSGLAEKFRAVMGKNVTVASPVGVVRTMKIVGLFRTGNALVDENQAYVLLKRSQNLLNRPTSPTASSCSSTIRIKRPKSRSLSRPRWATRRSPGRKRARI